MKKVTISLSTNSINKAIKEIYDYKKWVEAKSKQLCERLAIIGAQEASVRFTHAIYDGVNDSEVEVSPTDKGYAIIARGQAVAFIEFGSGVYHNPSEPYPQPRPQGIVGIGKYGKGKGKQKSWGFYDESKNLVITHGNPAAMPLWYASQEIERQVRQIAQEVFRS